LWTSLAPVKSFITRLQKSPYLADYNDAEVVTFEAKPVATRDVTDMVNEKTDKEQARQDRREVRTAKQKEKGDRELLRKLKEQYPDEGT
jgi:hypothetical protein